MTDRTEDGAWTPEQVLTPEQVAQVKTLPLNPGFVRARVELLCDSHEALRQALREYRADALNARAERDEAQKAAVAEGRRAADVGVELVVARTRIAELEAALRDAHGLLRLSLDALESATLEQRRDLFGKIQDHFDPPEMGGHGAALERSEDGPERSDTAESPHLHYPFGWDPACAECIKEKRESARPESASAPEPQP